MKILVIDDDRSFREYLVSLLERAGHEVRSLPSGLHLDTIADLSQFDAVVTDLYMPDVDGIETIRRIKTRASKLPVIGITGRRLGGNDSLLYAMTAFGAAAVLMKPLNEAALLAVLHRATSKGDEGAPAAAAASRRGTNGIGCQ